MNGGRHVFGRRLGALALIDLEPRGDAITDIDNVLQQPMHQAGLQRELDAVDRGRAAVVPGLEERAVGLGIEGGCAGGKTRLIRRLR